MTEKEKMLLGQLYDASDSELVNLRKQNKAYMVTFNHEEDADERQMIIKEWFGKTGDKVYIKPNFVSDYGSNIYLGENFYANFNCTFLDVCTIKIGKNALLGPNVQLLTPLHPLDPKERISGLEYGKPITIGDNVWIGGGATILPGVTLGDNVVVGAASVVTKSFGDNVVIAGNPARVIRQIDLH